MTLSQTPQRPSASHRPVAITILGWPFILTGVAGLISSALSLRGDGARPSAGAPAHGGELALVLAVRALAVVGGALLLRRVSWARWLLLAWMAWHVGLSLGHSPGELAMHVVLFALVLFLIFRRQTSDYFRRARVHDDRSAF